MLPTSGQISMSMIQKELGISGPISLNSPEVRKLAGKPTGEIRMSDLYGKSKFEGYMFDMKVGHYGDIPRRYDRFIVYRHFGYTRYDEANTPGSITKVDDTIGNVEVWELKFGDPWKVTGMNTTASLRLNRKIGNVVRVTMEGIGSWDFAFNYDYYGYALYRSTSRFTYSPISRGQVVRCSLKVVS